MLIRNVEVDGDVVDVRVEQGVIADIASGLEPLENESCFEGQGGALLPGLHDHHIHLNATATALNSVKCGPPEIGDEDSLIASLNSAAGNDWLRGIGYHDSVAGEIDRDWLDKNGPDRPVRIQHRGGRMWIFNSRAMQLLGIAIPDDGRLVDGDADVRAALGGQRPDLAALKQLLLSYGITGVTEVTPGNDRDDLDHYVAGIVPLRMSVMGGSDLHGADGRGQAHIGALKIHNHDHDLPSLEQLIHTVADAHDNGRPVAIHCVTRAEMMLNLAAIEEAGQLPGDRIEHAAIADEAAIEWMVRLGLTIVTQPHFVTERQAAYRKEVEAADLPFLWPLKSLADAGLKLAAGSDAPFGGLNPWAAMASAVSRPDDLGHEETIVPEQALALYTKPASDAGGDPRRIEAGAPADLCLLDRSWKNARRDLGSVAVSATWISGELVYDMISSTKPQSSAV